MNTITEMKKLKVVGITRDHNRCDCCGKENLAKTVTVIELETGVEHHFGVVCAASIDKYDTLKAAKEAGLDIKKELKKFTAIEKQMTTEAKICASNIAKKIGANNFEMTFEKAYVKALEICFQLAEKCGERWKALNDLQKNFSIAQPLPLR